MVMITEGRHLTNEAIVVFINEGRKKAIKNGAKPEATLDKLLDLYCVGYELLFKNVRDKIDASLALRSDPNSTPKLLEETQCNRLQLMIVFLAFEIHVGKLIREKTAKLNRDDEREFDDRFRGRSHRFFADKIKGIRIKIEAAPKIGDQEERSRTLAVLKKELKLQNKILR